jgi:hypothetical protein
MVDMGGSGDGDYDIDDDDSISDDWYGVDVDENVRMKIMMVVDDSGCGGNYVSDDAGRWEVDVDSHRTGIDDDGCGSGGDLIKFGNAKNRPSFV